MRQVNYILYTDTFFTKYQSMVLNTCYRIYKDAEFLHFTPMISKSEAGMSLDKIKLNVSVENEIFMDNAPEYTG